MANDDLGRNDSAFPQLDSELIDYQAYRERFGTPPREQTEEQRAAERRAARERLAQRQQAAEQREAKQQASQQRQQQATQQKPARNASAQQAKGQAAAGGFVPASTTYRPGPHGGVQGAYSGGQYSRSSVAYQNRSHGMSGGKKAAITIAIIAVIAAAAAVAYFVIRPMFYDTKTNEMQAGHSQNEVQALEDVLDTPGDGFDGQFTEPFTVLLLGSDAREDDPEMGARTDTIVLCRVDTSKNQITMMSIPRDTMVQLDGVGTCKINAAYYYGEQNGTGGAVAAVQAVKDLTGVEINYYAEINFEKLVGLIDAIGGIDVYNEEVIDDRDAGDVTIEAGDVHLDGEGALMFARSRAFADGDYTRQRHQRAVIDAIIQKGLSAPAGDLTGIIDTSLDFIFTTMKADFIKRIADEIRHNNDYEVTIYAANIPSAPAYIGDTSYVIADTAGLAEMVKLFEAGEDISQPIEVSSIDTDIANAGGSQTSPSGTSIYEEYTYYQPTNTYTEETTTTTDQTATTDTGAGTGTDATGAGTGADATGGGAGGAADAGGGGAAGGGADAGGGGGAASAPANGA